MTVTSRLYRGLADLRGMQELALAQRRLLGPRAAPHRAGGATPAAAAERCWEGVPAGPSRSPRGRGGGAPAGRSAASWRGGPEDATGAGRVGPVGGGEQSEGAVAGADLPKFF